MRIKFALAAALLMAGVSTASAADNWVGAWGFVPLPLPPGQAAAAAVPPGLAAMTPLGAPLPPPTAPAGPPPAPLLENPGNLSAIPGNVNLNNITVRQLVRVSVGGSQIRLRLTNEGSADMLPLGAIHVAEAGLDGKIVPGSDHVVTFNGRNDVIIPASSPLLSDPVNMTVRPLERLLVSIHIPGAVPRGGHALLDYVTETPGDNTAATALPGAKLARITALVSEVDVNAAAPTGVIVAVGDSITEGATSTGNAFKSWPDRLAERLAAAGKNWGVVNAGISGNRLLRYGTGPSTLSRLDRDVLSVPGIKAIILLEGINDIGNSFNPAGGRDPVTAESLIAADKQVIARAHDRGIKVYGALLTPYQGAGYASPAGEAVREALNNWIRTSGAFDGVIDLATPVADRANPLTFATQYNIRDKLHPNDAGYAAMGDAIDLETITK
ncbi:MAG: SGNH/GDSL hydrolase family protein [Alphaproteobacteria bacterium]|nr:SGNH/GDSL hydrolase family protein [Alphaproteobacteria bacterium]